MIKIHPYITLNGTCAEAIAFYEEAFQTKVMFVQRFGEANHPIPEEAKGLIMHATMEFEGNRIMFSDTFPGNTVSCGEQLTLAVVTDSAEKAKEIFGALSKDGEVTMELQETFWSPAFGMLQDKFGITWQISTEVK